MSATIAALLVGTAAVGGFGLYAGSSSSTTIPTKEEALEEVAKVVEQEDEPSQPIPEPESITPPSTPVPEALPEPVVQGGGSLQKQDGGFGKPTWAPLNSGDSLQSAMGLTKDQIGSTGSSLIAKWTGAKTAESIQLKLKEIDDQLRVLKVQKFNTESGISLKTTELQELRSSYLTALTNKTKYEKFSIYYDSELSKLLAPKPAGSDGSLKSIVENKFPKKENGRPRFQKQGNEKELNFDKWLEEAHKYFKTQSDEPEGINPKEGENKDAWWARIGKETSSVNKEPKDIETKLNDLVSKKTTNTTLLEDAIQSEQEQKPNYEQKVQELKDLRIKLQDTLKKIKELSDTRELVLVELSNYELPKGLFESFIKQKPIQKPSSLPTGQDRDRIIAQIKDLEQQIKEKKEEIDNEIDKQLNLKSSWKPAEDKNDDYGKLLSEFKELEQQRNNEILKLEGRTLEQKELVSSLSLLDKFIDYLKKNKVLGVTNFDNKDFKNVFNILTLMSKDTTPLTFIAHLDKYYNFFTTGTKIGMTKYNGEVIDKVIYFLLKFNVVIKNPEIIKTIRLFRDDFISKIQLSKTNLLSTLGYVNEINDTEKLRSEISNLPNYLRGILQGRNPQMQVFIETFETLKKSSKGVINLLFKDDKEKLERLNEVFNKRLMKKLEQLKITVDPFFPKQRIDLGEYNPPLVKDILVRMGQTQDEFISLVTNPTNISLDKLKEIKKSLDTDLRRFVSMIPNTSEENKAILETIKELLNFDITSIINKQRGGYKNGKLQKGDIIELKTGSELEDIPSEYRIFKIKEINIKQKTVKLELPRKDDGTEYQDFPLHAFDLRNVYDSSSLTFYNASDEENSYFAIKSCTGDKHLKRLSKDDLLSLLEFPYFENFGSKVSLHQRIIPGPDGRKKANIIVAKDDGTFSDEQKIFTVPVIDIDDGQHSPPEGEREESKEGSYPGAAKLNNHPDLVLNVPPKTLVSEEIALNQQINKEECTKFIKLLNSFFDYMSRFDPYPEDLKLATPAPAQVAPPPSPEPPRPPAPPAARRAEPELPAPPPSPAAPPPSPAAQRAAPSVVEQPVKTCVFNPGNIFNYNNTTYKVDAILDRDFEGCTTKMAVINMENNKFFNADVDTKGNITKLEEVSFRLIPSNAIQSAEPEPPAPPPSPAAAPAAEPPAELPAAPTAPAPPAPAQVYEKPKTQKELKAQVNAEREQRLAAAKPGLLEKHANPVVTGNNLLEQVQEARKQGLPEERQRRVREEREKAVALAKEAAEAPPLPAAAPSQPCFFRMGNQIKYNGSTYNVMRILEFDDSGCTTKMVIRNTQNNNVFNADVDGKGNITKLTHIPLVLTGPQRAKLPKPPPRISEEVLERSGLGVAAPPPPLPAPAPPAAPPAAAPPAAPPAARPPQLPAQAPPAPPTQDELRLELRNKKQILVTDFTQETMFKDNLLEKVREIRKNIAKIEEEDDSKLTEKEKQTIIEIKTKGLQYSADGKVTTTEQFINDDYRKIFLSYRNAVGLLDSILEDSSYNVDAAGEETINGMIKRYDETKAKSIMTKLQEKIGKIEGRLMPIRVKLITNTGGSRKNHLTRKQQWTRSKPSRFKTHRIY